MTTFTDNLTIKQIKQQAASIAETLAVPQFWLTDWLLYVIDKPSLFLMTDESYQLTDSESAKFPFGARSECRWPGRRSLAERLR